VDDTKQQMMPTAALNDSDRLIIGGIVAWLQGASQSDRANYSRGECTAALQRVLASLPPQVGETKAVVADPYRGQDCEWFDTEKMEWRKCRFISLALNVGEPLVQETGHMPVFATWGGFRGIDASELKAYYRSLAIPAAQALPVAAETERLDFVLKHRPSFFTGDISVAMDFGNPTRRYNGTTKRDAIDAAIVGLQGEKA
jgi:hypothetical protein